MRLVLTHPSGNQWILDTPDPALVGPWLKVIFDDLTRDYRPSYIPVEFTLEFK